MKSKQLNPLIYYLNCICLQSTLRGWELLVFARNHSFSMYFMPKMLKKLRCKYSIKLNKLIHSKKLNELK